MMPRLSAALCALLVVAGCVRPQLPAPPVQPFEPFDTFVAGVQRARATQYVGPPGFAVESPAAFDEMKQHVLQLYAGVTARNSFDVVSQWAKLDKYESNPDCYTADVHNITGNWGTYIFFGGPK